MGNRLHLFRLAEDFQFTAKENPPQSDKDGGMPATSLHIEVLENDRPKVRREFGARAADHLREPGPAGLLPKLTTRGVEPAMISGSGTAPGCAAVELFSGADGAKRFRVWRV